MRKNEEVLSYPVKRLEKDAAFTRTSEITLSKWGGLPTPPAACEAEPRDTVGYEAEPRNQICEIFAASGNSNERIEAVTAEDADVGSSAIRRPTLSVLMPNYNHARFLADAIKGIATQSRPPDEFLILDDASTDNSLEVIAPFLPQLPFLRLIRHERNQGVIAASQRLFAEAQGDYVFAAAADDIRLPDFFEPAMRLAEQYPQAGLVFGIVRMVDHEGHHLCMGEASRWREPLYASPARFWREYLEVERPSHSGCSGTIYRRDAIQRVGGYRAELGSWADTFAFRAIGLKHGVCYLPREVVHIRELPGSFHQQSHAQPRAALDMIVRAADTMLSAEFRDRFPADYVRRWRRAYRWQVIRDYFLGPEVPGRPRPAFLMRNVRRLPRLLPTLSLFLYRGNP